MFGKHGTVWQIGLAVVGLAIVAVVLVGPHGRGTTPLVAAPTADVASSRQPVQAILQPQPVQQQSSSDQQSGGQAAAGSDASAAANPGDGSQPASTSTTTRASGSAALPAVPAVPVVNNVARTLFSDNFASDPLGAGLPTGWLLADPASSSSSSSGGLLGGLPVVGSLLGGLTGGGSSSAASVVPSIVDDGTHVLSRPNGSWSHLEAGPVSVDSSASANVKMLGQSSGFVGVAGRFQNVNNSVVCGLNSGGSVLQLWQIVNGQAQMLASSPVSAAMGTFHTITMALQGGQMSCSLDGANLLHATGTLTAPGKIGLVALGDMTSEFSNVVDTALP